MCAYIYIYIYMYIYIVTRKYYSLIHFLCYGGRRYGSPASKNQQTIVVSRIMEREAVSLSPTLLLQADMGMGEPHSLLAMYGLTEKQTCDYDRYWERKRQKADTWIFKLRKLDSCRLFIKGRRHIGSCRFFVGEWRHVIWDMKETQIPK